MFGVEQEGELIHNVDIVIVQHRHNLANQCIGRGLDPNTNHTHGIHRQGAVRSLTSHPAAPHKVFEVPAIQGRGHSRSV